MGTFIVVFAAMIVVTIIMAVGVIMGRKPISGSCGGMAALGMDVACDICGGDQSKCDNDGYTRDYDNDDLSGKAK